MPKKEESNYQKKFGKMIHLNDRREASHHQKTLITLA